MAFIRQYAQASGRAAFGAGDPFSFRIPKKLRKLKLGRALGKVARFAAPFIPGVGGIAASIASGGATESEAAYAPPSLAEQLAAAFGTDVDTVRGFARSYGVDVGDPTRVPKRKAASSGPKAKAARKAAKRAAPKKGTGRRPDITGHDTSASDARAAAMIAALKRGDLAGGIAGEIGSLVTGRGRGAAFGGHHRRMNPTNSRALTRALRRVEGFEKFAKRVMGHKLFRKVRGPLHASSRGGARGHKAGCGCAVCRRAA